MTMKLDPTPLIRIAEDRGYNNSEAARVFGISRRNYARWRNNGQTVYRATAERICDRLELNPHELWP